MLMSNKRRWVDALFSPRGVAVVGSSGDPSKLAWGTLQAVLKGNRTKQDRAVVAIDRHASDSRTTNENPFRFQSPFDVPSDLASRIDQAVLVTGCHSTLQHMRDCIHNFPSLQCVNVVAGGFREQHKQGINLEQQLVQEARDHNIRLIGPNSVGAMDVQNNFSSMFLRVFPNPGGLTLLSQSGGVCGAAIELTCQNPGLGFSKVLSLGNAADVGFVDALTAVGDDVNTQVILLYLEGLGENDAGDEFIRTARNICMEKPILALDGYNGQELTERQERNTIDMAAQRRATQRQ